MKRLVPLVSGLVFFLTGLALIPWPGLQNDELFFSGPIYSPDAAFFLVPAGALKIPFMVISYTGALKTWLYAGLFQLVAPSEWSVRIPVLLMGVATVWLTWMWTRRIAGDRAAAIAAILLATDTVFLMTNLFDWGPVALQHLLLMGGLVSIQKWLGNNSKLLLALAFFLWGLGMWDKALMAWPLIGLAVASFCIFPRQVVSRLRPAAALIAIGSFTTGALPLIWYNVARPGETATRNVKFAAVSDASDKLSALRETIDGSALFGYIVYKDSITGKREPRGWEERFPVWLSRLSGNRHTSWMLPAWVLGFVFSLFLWNSPARTPLLFLLIVMAVAWVQMALTRGAGGAPHHAILLWPFPPVFLGIAFNAMADRIPRHGAAALSALVILLAARNLLTTNEYLASLIVNGGSGGWTDAIYRLSDSVHEKFGGWIGVLDWGYLNGLRMLHEGDLPLFLMDVDAGRKELERQIGSPDYLFIQHTEDKQIFPGINDRLRKSAEELGYVERLERTIPDRNGRPVFELFRFQKVAGLRP